MSGLSTLLLCFAAGCGTKPAAEPAIRIEHEIAPWPARVGPVTVILRISNPSGKNLTRARVSLEGDMSHPGMRPELGDTTETAPGYYQGKLTFTMPGDWFILVHIKLPSGETLERQISVPGVRAN